MTSNQQNDFTDYGKIYKPQIAWDSIPRDSILEKTPRELFSFRPEHEAQYVSWLETLPIEMVIPDPAINCPVMTGLYLVFLNSRKL
jgi:hypothetical protein